VDGKIISSNLRLPAEGNWLCNAAQGGKAVPADPDEDEKMIIKSISKDLKKRGILIYGMDTLVNDNDKRVLSELNTLSVGGIGISNTPDQWERSAKVADLIVKYIQKIS
jgi:glutathione synthase